MTGRLTGDQHAYRVSTSVQSLMAVAGGNLQSLARLQNKFTVLDFEGQFAFENVEELVGPNVGVPNLA